MLPIDFSERLELELARRYRESDAVLHKAILYALLGPGKRLRPKLVFLSALASGAVDANDAWSKSLPAMLAVEMVHCYSLVHDDLPAMDNDDYRRGRLSCHKKYGEAVGILVGDALIADAFDILSTSSTDALFQIRELAQAIGSTGMVLGQEADLASQNRAATWDQWREINRLKTGRLFESACVMGALSVGASEVQVNNLRHYARSFGMAFQLKDDLSDDALTVKLLGADRVKELLKENVDTAMHFSLAIKSEPLFLTAQQLGV